MKKLFSILLAMVLLLGCCGAALAETVTMNGTVVATGSQTLTSAVGGEVDEVYVAAGNHVKAGDKLATIATTKVYAKEDGTAYVFGEVGDAADTVIARYGAVAYIEPANTYTISASTKYSYDAETNRIVHPGESVYLRSYENQNHKGTGVVTIIDGTSFTIEVLTGNFNSDEQVIAYRDKNYTNESRIGRGAVSRAALITYEGSGSIVSYAVKNGQAVKKGDLLFETVEGDFIPGETVSCDVVAPADGVVTSVSVSEGAILSANGTVAAIDPDSGMRVEATVSESDLANVTVGGKVKVEFTYVSNGEMVVTGKVEKISLLAAEASSDTEEASYTVTILLDNTENVRYGMNVVVTTVEETVKPAATAPAQ